MPVGIMALHMGPKEEASTSSHKPTPEPGNLSATYGAWMLGDMI